MSVPSPSLPQQQSPVSAIALVYWTVVALVLAGGLMSGALMAWPAVMTEVDAAVWRSFAVATAIGVAAGVAGLFPVLLAVRSSPQAVAMSYLAGMGLRMMTFLGGLIVATQLGGATPRTTAVFSLVYVMAALASEAGVLARGMSKVGVRAGKRK